MNLEGWKQIIATFNIHALNAKHHFRCTNNEIMGVSWKTKY